MADVPVDVRREVISHIYAEMDRLQWEELPHQDKSVAYERFVADPRIGRKLSPFIGSDKIRVWIKDGPAKEYGRALEGVGPYAVHTGRAYPGPDHFVSQVLGAEWSVREGSVADKPMRCWAQTEGGHVRFVIWGPLNGLKDLVWQAVLHRSEQLDSQPVIVVTTRGMTQLPQSDRDHVARVCEIVGAEMREARRSVVDKPRSQ